MICSASWIPCWTRRCVCKYTPSPPAPLPLPLPLPGFSCARALTALSVQVQEDRVSKETQLQQAQETNYVCRKVLAEAYKYASQERYRYEIGTSGADGEEVSGLLIDSLDSLDSIDSRCIRWSSSTCQRCRRPGSCSKAKCAGWRSC
jgi:hypothetical protein